MKTALTEGAVGVLAPKVLKGFRLSWLVYGAAAYFGLKLMSKRGIFPKQADAALNVIDQGLGAIKNQVGLGRTTPEARVTH